VTKKNKTINIKIDGKKKRNEKTQKRKLSTYLKREPRPILQRGLTDVSINIKPTLHSL
jgi:hypothetical protein